MKIECQAVLERDFSLLGCHAVDLSPEGVAVCSNTVVKAGEQVVATFRLPGGWLDAEATVSHVVESRSDDDDRRVALCFQPLPGEQQELLCDHLLDEFLDQLPTD